MLMAGSINGHLAVEALVQFTFITMRSLFNTMTCFLLPSICENV